MPQRNMSEPSAWPPPPQTPNLLAVHDEFLSACVRDSTPNPPLSRLLLVRKLCQKIGNDSSFCRAVVDDFCDRHRIFMPGSGVGWWLLQSLPAIAVAMIFLMMATGYFLLHEEATAATHAAKVASYYHLRYFFRFGGVLTVMMTSATLGIVYQEKKARVDAAEAVTRFNKMS